MPISDVILELVGPKLELVQPSILLILQEVCLVHALRELIHAQRTRKCTTKGMRNFFAETLRRHGTSPVKFAANIRSYLKQLSAVRKRKPAKKPAKKK